MPEKDFSSDSDKSLINFTGAKTGPRIDSLRSRTEEPLYNYIT
jgi:hypothetical protein